MGGLLAVSSLGFAAEIDSGVIHNYDYLGVGYGYLHELADDLNAHGGVGQFSFEEQNFILSAGGGYFWGDNDDVADVELWNASASLGYVIRLAENHLNIIPSFGGGYSEIDVEGAGSADSWSILPSISLSYALNNRISIGGGYTYAYNLDAEEETHLFNAGAKFALLHQVGLSVNAIFAEDEGFQGVTAGVEFHF